MTLASNTESFDSSAQTLGMTAVVTSVQGWFLPGGRVWVRGGVGWGWLCRTVNVEGRRIAINLSTSDGLALAGATGVDLWRRQRGRVLVAASVEFDYVTVRSDGLHANAPTARVGLTIRGLDSP